MTLKSTISEVYARIYKMLEYFGVLLFVVSLLPTIFSIELRPLVVPLHPATVFGLTNAVLLFVTMYYLPTPSTRSDDDQTVTLEVVNAEN